MNVSYMPDHFDRKTWLKEGDHSLISFLARVQQKQCHSHAKTAYKELVLALEKGCKRAWTEITAKARDMCD